MGRKGVIVTDSGEGDNWLRVTNDDGEQQLVEAGDREGVAIAIDTLSGPYEER